MPLITAENAADMAKRRWEAERERKAMPRILPAPTDDKGIPDELACVRDQLKALNEQLEDCTESEEWDRLTRSKERLFRIWARLAQLPSDPKPVQLKAAQSRPATAEPIGPAPQAVAHQPKPEEPS